MLNEDGSVKVNKVLPPSPLTRWYDGDTLIKELDVVGKLTSAYKEPTCTRCEIGTHVTSIGNSAFSVSSWKHELPILTSVTIPDSVTSIEDWAFSYCSGLTEVKMSKNITSMSGSGIFYDCINLKKINLGQITSIGEDAFRNCSSLENIIIPKTLKFIQKYAFLGCSSLKEIEFEEGIEAIKSYAFDGCASLTSLTLPDSLVELGDGSFRNCISLTKLITGNNIKTINSSVFAYCGLTNIQLNSNLEIIGNGAFQWCNNLQTFTIPSNIKEIENFALSNCSQLSVINYNGNTYDKISSIENVLKDNNVILGNSIFTNTALEA